MVLSSIDKRSYDRFGEGVERSRTVYYVWLVAQSMDLITSASLHCAPGHIKRFDARTLEQQKILMLLSTVQISFLMGKEYTSPFQICVLVALRSCALGKSIASWSCHSQTELAKFPDNPWPGGRYKFSKLEIRSLQDFDEDCDKWPKKKLFRIKFYKDDVSDASSF